MAQTIPILDLAPQMEVLGEQINEAVQKVLYSGRYIMGAEVAAFQEEAAAYLGVKHAIGLNSGTDALVLALRALGVGQGDEVITTSLSFFATAESIWHAGATPVFVDIAPDSMNINVGLLEDAITERTKAIMPVHLFGRPVAMKQLLAIAEKHSLNVIEDCAQSFGARCADTGKQTGSMGDVGTFSFYPTKNLGAFGDGGLLTTNDDAIARTVRKLQNHGSAKRYHHELLGYNSRLDEVQAAILRVKLPHIDAWNQARTRVASYYNQLLQGTQALQVPEVVEGHIFHQYTVQIHNGMRDHVKQRLQDDGISTNIYYPIPQHKFLQGEYPSVIHTMQVTDRVAEAVLSLPIWPEITQEVQEKVATALLKALG